MLELLPTISNDKAMKMKEVFIMIVSRIQYSKLCCSDIVTWHKDHKYYEEMSTKSNERSLYYDCF